MDSCKEIGLLTKDHKYIRKKEKDITIDDMNNAKYILAQANDPRLYSIMAPNKYFIFDYAKIDYQITIIEDEFSDIMGFQYMKPVNVQTNSLSDLINLMNCIQRLDIVNRVILDTNYFTSIHFDIAHFGVSIYKDSFPIITRNYHLLDDHYSSFYNPMNIINAMNKIYKFYGNNIEGDDIYTYEPIFEITKDKEWRIIDGTDDDQLIRAFDNESLIGVYLRFSNMVAFLSADEFYKMNQIESICSTFAVIDISDECNMDLQEYIKEGDYLDAENLGEAVDYFFSSYNKFYNLRRNKDHIDIFANLDFAIQLGNLAMDELYKTDDGIELYCQRIRSVLCLVLKISNGVKKQMMFTEETLLSFSEIISILK